MYADPGQSRDPGDGVLDVRNTLAGKSQNEIAFHVDAIRKRAPNGTRHRALADLLLDLLENFLRSALGCVVHVATPGLVQQTANFLVDGFRTRAGRQLPCDR